MSIEVVVAGEASDTLTLLRRLDGALNSMMPLWMGGVLNPFLRRRARERFANEGGAEVGGPWVPLAQTTVQIRQNEGYSGAGPINQRTTALMRYITSAPALIAPAGVGFVYKLPGDLPSSSELLSKVRTAQAGGVAPSGKGIPARPVLGMDATDLAFIMTSLGQHLERTVRTGSRYDAGEGASL